MSAWSDYGSPSRLAEIWCAVEILGPLHHAISYRAAAEACAPPVDPEMATGTVTRLRQVITALHATS